jgi:hypothetical protein
MHRRHRLVFFLVGLVALATFIFAVWVLAGAFK